jgi:hypothetical protein
MAEGALWAFVALCLWTSLQLRYGRVATRYSLDDERLPEDVRREGVLFGGDDGERRLSVYHRDYSCIEIAHWHHESSEGWRRDEEHGPKTVLLSWFDDGRRLEVVDERDCSREREVRIPERWAISPGGERLAWVAGSPGGGDETGRRVYVATPRGGRFPLEGNVLPVASTRLDHPTAGVRGLRFVSEDRLLIWLESEASDWGDEALLWDCVDDRQIGRFKLVKNSSVLAVQGDWVASASANDRVVAFSEVRGDRILTHVVSEENAAEENGRQVTGLALGRANLAAVGLSDGKYWVIRRSMTDGRMTTKVVVPDWPLDHIDQELSQAVWLDDHTMAFAGSFGSLFVVPLERKRPDGTLTPGAPYGIPLAGGAQKVLWLEIVPAGAGKLLVTYGTAGGTYVGTLSRAHEPPALGDLLELFFWMVTFLAFVLQICEALERRTSRRATLSRSP